MTPRERAEQVFRDHINHHALYATDAQTIMDALEVAFQAQEFDWQEQLHSARVDLDNQRRAHEAEWKEIRRVMRCNPEESLWGVCKYTVEALDSMRAASEPR